MERTVDEGRLTVEFLFTEPLATWVADTYADRLGRILASDHIQLHVVESLPHAFYLAERDEETTLYLGVHGDHDNFIGYVENDTPAAVDWVRSLWERHREGAVEFERHLRAESRWPRD